VVQAATCAELVREASERRPRGVREASERRQTICRFGKSATVGDAFIAGVCSGSELGFCAADKDCAAVEDGNVCNGSLYCNKASKTCEVNPATVITCPKVADTACLQAQCVPVTGQCLLVPVEERQTVRRQVRRRFADRFADGSQTGSRTVRRQASAPNDRPRTRS